MTLAATVAVLGFVSALLYGASDFLGGLASRRMTPLLASTLGFGVAIVVAGVAVLVTDPVWSREAVVLGIIAGACGAIGTWALYAALALGPMSILSPAVAAIYAIVPATVGIALGERFGVVGSIALVVVVVAGILLASSRDAERRRPSTRALLISLVSGLGFAGYIVAIDATPEESGFVPLFVDLLAGGVLFGAVLLLGRLRSGPRELAGLRDRRAVALALGAGLLLVSGNLLLVAGLHLGDLATLAVLNSLYPLGTVALAVVVLRERPSRLQVLGIVLAFAGAVALALGGTE
ncbi:GRP family sugar transporter [Pseudolysinimonas sp.]|jgi:drug/metabolite transporter (DMT)-like permease|uniref:GRP family sugar transporter n=1 Tax=Pseudolysinimonas sp. TaxID=2680009 RepID=UPI0037839267